MTVRVLRLDEPHGGVGDADGDLVAHARRVCPSRHRLGRRSGQLLQRGFRARRPRPSADRPSPCRSTKPGAGSPSIAGTTGTVRRAGLLEIERERAGHDLRDIDAERRAHFVGAQMEQARPGRAPREIEHRHDLARLEPAEQRGRSAQPHVHRVGGSPTISSSSGMLRNSSGTRRLRSTTCSPATISHSSAASATASDLQPEMAERV